MNVTRYCLLWLVSIGLSSGQTPIAVNVCELFADPSAWNNKLVSLEGSLTAGGGESEPALSGKYCSVHIEVKGLSFRNVIELTEPGSRFAVHRVSFEWDRDSRKAYRIAINSIDRHTEHVELTVIGVFETREPLDNLVRNGVRLGFGHLNESPAQILAKTVTGIAVRKNQ